LVFSRESFFRSIFFVHICDVRFLLFQLVGQSLRFLLFFLAEIPFIQFSLLFFKLFLYLL